MAGRTPAKALVRRGASDHAEDQVLSQTRYVVPLHRGSRSRGGSAQTGITTESSLNLPSFSRSLKTVGTFFCSDLFFQPGGRAPLTETDIVAPARDAIREGARGPLANDIPYTPYTDATLLRRASLEPRTVAVMHGSSYRGDGGRALREPPAAIRVELGQTQSRVRLGAPRIGAVLAPTWGPYTRGS